MAIAYKSAGTGSATEASGGNLAPTCPATVDANDILIAHVWWEGITDGPPTTPSGWTLLYGPAFTSNTSRTWIYGKIAAGTEDGASISFGTPAVTTARTARIYSFSGYVSGTIAQIVRGFTKRFTVADGNLSAAAVATTATGALAVSLFGANDDVSAQSTTGETGGDWVEAVAEYTQAGTTPQTLLHIMTCTPTGNPGYVSDGVSALGGVVDGTVIGFEIADAPLTSVAFAGSWFGTASNGGSPSVTMRAAEGDFLIAAYAAADVTDYDMTNDAMLASGWTLIADLYANDSQDANLGVFCKFMGNTPDAQVDFQGSGNTSSGNCAGAMAFRGVDKTRPFDVAPTTATGTESSNADPPSITPSGTPGVAVVIVGEAGHASGLTFTLPTGYTTNGRIVDGNDTWDTSLAIGYKLGVTSTENPGVITHAGDALTNAWVACTLALRPIQNEGIYFVGSATDTDEAAGNPIITLPTNMQEGDLVVVAYSIPTSGVADQDMAVVTPSGYTEVADLYADDSQEENLGVFYKFMGSSPDTTVELDGIGNASSGQTATATVWRGVDAPSPFDVTPTTSTTLNSGIPIPPAIDFVSQNVVILVATGSSVGGLNPLGYTFPPEYIGIEADQDKTWGSMTGQFWASYHMVSDPETPGSPTIIAGAVDSGLYACASVTMALKVAALVDVGNAAIHAVGTVRY